MTIMQLRLQESTQTRPALSTLLMAVTVLVLQERCWVTGQRHFYQKFYSYMFASYDTSWQDRECLLTVQGREYVGMLKTPQKGQE